MFDNPIINRFFLFNETNRYKDNSPGIQLKDYLDFFLFLNNINDVDTALTFYNIAGASIEPSKDNFVLIKKKEGLYLKL